MYASRTFDEAPSYVLTDDLFGEPGYSSADMEYSKGIRNSNHSGNARNNREQFIGNNSQISGIQPQFSVAPSAKNLDFATNKDMNKLYNAVNKMYINVCDKVSNIMNNNNNNSNSGGDNSNTDDKNMCKQLNKLNKRLTTIIYLLLFIILVVVIVMIIKSVKYIKFNNPVENISI